MPRQHNRPLTSYDPRFLEVWRRAAKEDITLMFGSKARATKFRQELNELRAELRRHNHTLTTQINSAKVRIFQQGLDWILQISLIDHDYDDVFAAAGISPPSADLLELEPDLEIPDPEAEDDYAQALEDWCGLGSTSANLRDKPGAVLKSIPPASKKDEPQ